MSHSLLHDSTSYFSSLGKHSSEVSNEFPANPAKRSKVNAGIEQRLPDITMADNDASFVNNEFFHQQNQYPNSSVNAFQRQTMQPNIITSEGAFTPALTAANSPAETSDIDDDEFNCTSIYYDHQGSAPDDASYWSTYPDAWRL